MVSPRSPTLLCVGNAVVDVIVEGQIETVLKKFCSPSQNWDVKYLTAVCRDDPSLKHRVIEHLWNHQQGKRVVGGSALNTARVASWFAQQGLPYGVGFLGSIGKDERGQMIVEACEHQAVQPILQSKLDTTTTFEQGTGVCAVLVDSKSRDRSLLCFRGAAEWLDVSFLQNVLGTSEMELLGRTSIVYATSFHLTTLPRFQVVQSLARTANSLPSCRFALNLSCAYILGRVRAEVECLLPLCSFVFGNCEELMSWMGKEPSASCTNLLECTVQFATIHSPNAWVVITNGPDGCVFAKVESDGTTTKGTVPVPAKYQISFDSSSQSSSKLLPKLQDTNGAGDAFVAGFLVEVARQTNGQNLDVGMIQNAIDRGQYCSFEILQRDGCTCPEYSPRL